MGFSRRALYGVVSVLGILGGNIVKACTTDLLLDDYANYAQNLNRLGSWTSDDGTMTSITSSASAKTLTFTANPTTSYFYSTFDCMSLSTQGYDTITFPVKGPAGGSFTLEIQASSGGCGTAYQSFFVAVTGITGSTQTITVPLSSFSGANLNAVSAFVWSTFKGDGSWTLGELKFHCGSPSTPTNTITTAPPTTTTPPPTGTCANPLLIDDWASQSRLTFLFYNAMLNPSSDDGSMSSIVVSNNHVTLTPKSGSYFYSSFDCVSATGKYGGISLPIKAAAGTRFTVQLQSSSTCDAGNFQEFDRTSAQLGWTFDGTEKLYNIPFSQFSGLDTGKLTSILLYSMSGPITLGPMAFYCGNTPTEWKLPVTTIEPSPTATVPITTATPSTLVIDRFTNKDTNALGFWHGADEGLSATYSGGTLTIKSSDSDYGFYTTITETCRDMNSYNNGYLHIVYSGSNEFTIALQQHNSACNSGIAPYPETWDVVEAKRYAVSPTDIYVPLAHFNINKSRVVGIALKGFTNRSASTVLSRIEISKTAPSNVKIPSKIPTAPIYFACTRPNSFAFAIDDGVPELAQQVMQIVREENIKVTFFTVGAPLLDPSTNLSSVYTEMMSQGHQMALHSFTHPKMEGLPSTQDIDWELQEDVRAFKESLGISSKYFRAPFGNEGARMRQRLEKNIPGVKLIGWSVDVEDWLWAESPTPEKQLEAFKRDVNKGGNLVVMHYLYPSTVQYLKEFIKIAKATGKQLMRVDQCLQDPNAPPL